MGLVDRVYRILGSVELPFEYTSYEVKGQGKYEGQDSTTFTPLRIPTLCKPLFYPKTGMTEKGVKYYRDELLSNYLIRTSSHKLVKQIFSKTELELTTSEYKCTLHGRVLKSRFGFLCIATAVIAGYIFKGGSF